MELNQATRVHKSGSGSVRVVRPASSSKVQLSGSTIAGTKLADLPKIKLKRKK